MNHTNMEVTTRTEGKPDTQQTSTKPKETQLMANAALPLAGSCW
jgi:hypothetical protein